MKKAIKCIAVVLLLMSAVLVFNPNAKHNAVRYVKSNTEKLTETAEDLLEQNISVHIKYNGWDANCFTATDTPIVQFTVSAFGIAPSSRYKGFYYSPEDIPLGYQGVYAEMIPEGDRWIYHFEGDNEGFTTKICDNWYWFEVKT